VRTIEDFGDLATVGDRLLAAERSKVGGVYVFSAAVMRSVYRFPQACILIAYAGTQESTLSVAMVSQGTRVQEGDSAAQLYDYEYELNSTRGRKRILNTVTIFNGKLYILNAAYKCDKPGGADAQPGNVSCIAPPESLELLRGIAASFRVGQPSGKQ
jgi:hypothetical protein